MRALAPRGAAGFTLLELMIGLVLLGLMLTVLFSGLRLGANSWDTVERRLASATERHLAMGLVERQLSLAMNVLHDTDEGAQALAFRGDPDRVTWVSPLPAHRGGGGVQYMSLGVGRTDHGEGLVLTWRLFHPDVLDMAPREVSESALLLEGVSGLRLAYYGVAPDSADRRDWFDQWGNESRMPELVRVEFEADDSRAPIPALFVALKQARLDTTLEF